MHKFQMSVRLPKMPPTVLIRSGLAAKGSTVHGEGRSNYKMYLDRSFFFNKSPSASDISCSVTVYVHFSPLSTASLACTRTEILSHTTP